MSGALAVQRGSDLVEMGEPMMRAIDERGVSSSDNVYRTFHTQSRNHALNILCSSDGLLGGYARRAGPPPFQRSFVDQCRDVLRH